MEARLQEIKSGSVGSQGAHKVDLSIIVPLYNEEQNLEPLYRELKTVLDDCGRSYEIVFVDDGSTDGSAAVLETLCRRDETVTMLEFRRNFGKAMALSAGFDEASGNIIITLDADLQDNPVEIPRFIERIQEGYDLVSGWKRHRQDPISKTLPSRMFNAVVSRTTGLRLHDFNCGFKAYSRSLVDNLHIYGELHRYIPALAFGDGFRVTELAVDHRPRIYGKSKYGIERFTRGLLDLLTVLFLTRYMKKPLHLFGSIGLVAMILGMAINSYLAIIWFRGAAIGHRPLLSLGVLLMVLGVQFVSTGLIGEMLTHSHGSNETSPVARRLSGSEERGESH